MTKNNKPVLSILIDTHKRERFSEFARRNNLSMGYLVNQAIDRLLAANSMDIYRDSKSIEGIPRLSVPAELPTGLTREAIEEIVEASIDKERERVDVLVKSYTENKEITSIAIEDIRAELSEVSGFARHLQGEIVKMGDRVDALAKPVQSGLEVPAAKSSRSGEAEPDTKTWGEFFKMVGIEALAAGEAQGRENASIRNQQADEGIRVAREKGLGDWIVKVKGRSFVRVSPSQTSKP